MEKYECSPWIARDIEKDLLKSYAFAATYKGYWVSGLKHVGKTALLTKFGKERFRKFHVLDLTVKEQRLKAESEFSKAFSIIGGTAYDKRYASAALKNCFADFEDSPDEFLLIDEIQESEFLYNLARWITRGLDAKVCFAGSFLGDPVKWERTNNPSGDVMFFEMLPVTFGEFARSIPGLEKYRAVRDFANDDPDLALSDPKPYWDTFYELGGFPQPLAASLAGDPTEALKLRDYALNDFAKSVQEKTQEDLSLEDWKNLLGYTVLAILCNEDPTNLDNLKLIANPAECPATISLKLAYKMMKWLKGCDILTYIPVIESLDYPRTFLISMCEFTNYLAVEKLVEISGNSAIGKKHEEAKTEMFVLNELRHLNNLCKKSSLRNYILDNRHAGFSFLTNEEAMVLVEAENSGMETLAWGADVKRPDFFIKLSNRIGFVQGNTFEIPIWHIDRLPIIIGLIDIAYTNEMTLEKTYERYVSGIDDKVVKKPLWDDHFEFDEEYEDE